MANRRTEIYRHGITRGFFLRISRSIGKNQVSSRMMKAGRPPFRPTRKQRLRVEELISCGMTLGNISKRIGISEKTLRLHFPDELAYGRALRRAEVIELLYAAARNGDGAALCKLADMTDEDRSADREAPAKPSLRRRMGKKEEAAEAARTAGIGTDWGDDLQIPTSTVN